MSAQPITSSRFNIAIITPPSYTHSAAFNELAETLQYGLQALGYAVGMGINQLDAGAVNIVFGAHLLSAQAAQNLPANTIIYNTEQIDVNSVWMKSQLFNLIQQFETWDYSHRNIEQLQQRQIGRKLQLLPVGFMPQMARIPVVEQDIDVLFYGAINERRVKILNELKASGLNVVVVFNCYGKKRDALIARAKVVLNVHFYEAKIFEIVRVSYLLANRKAVVSEVAADTDIEPMYRQAIAGAPYQQLVATCKALVADTAKRHALEQHAFAVMSARRQDELLRGILQVPTEQALVNGLTLHKQGKLTQAAELYRQVLQHWPDCFDALHLLGLIEIQHQHLPEALDLLSRALLINPQHPTALANQGALLVALKRYPEALQSCDRALALNPNALEVLNNRAAALINLKRFEEALHTGLSALQQQPDFVDALNNVGNALNRLKRYSEALPYYERALQLNPQYVEAWFNRGNVYKHLKQYERALSSFDQAIALRSHYPEAWYDKGNTLNRLKRFADAAQAFATVLQQKPHYDYALGNFIHARLQCCDWRDYDALCQQLIQAVRQGLRVDNPFSFLTVPSSAADQLACARLNVLDRFRALPAPLAAGVTYQHKRLRIAYLSADFHNHATAYLMAELFECHDKNRFDIRVFSFGKDKTGEMRQRIARACDQFVDVAGVSEAKIAAMLREQEIDIAIDLKGFTQDSRTDIFAARPAPIQVNYLGYPGSMGAEYIDYIIADHYVIPHAQEQYYSEAVVRLPGCYQVNDSQRAIADVTPSRYELGLPDDGFVFCSFNNNYKITPSVFAVWMRLLKQVPGSVLWLLADNPVAVQNLRLQAQTHGIDVERLVFAERLGLAEHLARHKQADLFLDTIPVNAHTSASDALWAGLPVLTLSTDSFVGRVAGSLLTTLGLTDLIARDLADYEAKALALALHPEQIVALKEELQLLRYNRLFDCKAYTRYLESAYLSMHQRYQQGLEAKGFDVPV